MKYRIISIALCLLLLFSVAFGKTVTAIETDGTEASSEDTDAAGGLDITAKACVLIENSSGKILYSKEKDEELVPASITKIMTLLLIFDAISEGKIALKDKVSVSEYAASMGGSQVFLEPGETQTVDDMLKCICIASANDASVAMAEYISGSESAFIEKMNKKAAELGMKHTKFKNCNGLDDDIESGHYSSAYDVALMSQALVNQYPQVSDYSTVWMDEITHTTKKGNTQFGLTNTNKLVRSYDGITGLKTGSTSKAKYCLAATAKRNGVSLTAVIMAAPDYKVRFSQAAALLDYGFANCVGYTDNTKELVLEEIPIKKGMKDTVIPRVQQNFEYTLSNGESPDDIQREITYDTSLAAPIKEGDCVGMVSYSLAGSVLSEIPIVASENIKKAGYGDCMNKLMKQWMGTA